MKPEEKKITLGAMKTLRHHRLQMERKNREIGWTLTGLDQPLLPEHWTDEDAWTLAGALTELMRQVVWFDHTHFNEANPYPAGDTLLKDIRYYNDLFPDVEPTEPPYTQEDLSLWTWVLYCGVLATANNPEFLYTYDNWEPCSLSRGTFADLKELITGTVMSFDGPQMSFDIVLSQLEYPISEKRYLYLKEKHFAPNPPDDGSVKLWNEWLWLDHHPCRGKLRDAIDLVQSKAVHDDVLNFIYSVATSYLNVAIDLYLYQTGTPGMLDDSFYVTYGILCQTQEQIKAAMAEEE